MTTGQADTRTLRFAGFDLDLAGPELRLRGRVVPLRPKSLALISHLAQRPGQLVRKEDLVDAVWGSTAVTDATLARTLFDAREALGDDSRQPRFIETVHRIGFRFLGQIDAATGGPAPAPASASAALVGRTQERQRLVDLRKLAESGARQTVFLAGEAGIGKTCILDAFLADAGNGNGSRDVLPALIGRGQCIEHYGAAEAYLPLLDALGELCRGASAGVVVPVLRRTAPTWFAQFPWLIGDDDRDALERELRGVSSDRMLRELAQALETISQRHLLVLALEDLHWCDSATADLLAFLARRPAPARLMVVATYRPVDAILSENSIRLVHHELVRQNRCQNIAIEALPAADVGALVARRFDAASFAEELAVVVHRRTEGIPLFVVSMLDDLVSQGRICADDGGWQLGGEVAEVEGSVPDDLRQMVRTQVERLGADERAAVEAASVVGISFSAAAAAAALQKDPVDVEDVCEQMAQRGVFLDRSGAAPWADGTSASVYTFRHALYRDALYQGIPAARRRRLHQRVGERLEAAYANDLAHVAGVLGMHFEEAGDHARASRHLRQAGEVAARRGAPREAVALFARTRAHLERLPAGVERTVEELMMEMAAGPALSALQGYASEEVEQIFARARERCRELGDGPQLFPVLWGLWAFWCVRGQLNHAIELASQSYDLAVQGGDREMIIEAHHAMWVTHFFRGEVGEAGRHLDAALSLYDPAHHHAHVMLFGQDPGVVAHAYRGLVHQLQGDYRSGERHADEGMRLARQLGHPVSMIFGVGFNGWFHLECGDAERCRIRNEECLEIGTSNGLAFWQAHSSWILSRAIAVTDPGRGIAGMRAGIDALCAIGARMGVAGYLANLARTYFTSGDFDEARRLVDEAWSIGERTGEWLGGPELLMLRGDLELSADRGAPASSTAEAYYREAIDLARRQEATILELRAALKLAGLADAPARKPETCSLLKDILARMPDDDAVEKAAARAWLES